MESGTLDIFTEQSHLSALDNLLFSRNLCETVNFYLVESAIFWYLNYCCSRQHEVCFLILEIENFPANKIFFSSYSSQLLHYHLRSSYVISSFFTWKFPSLGNFLHQARFLHTVRNLRQCIQTAFHSMPTAPLKTSYLIKNPMIKYAFWDIVKKLENTAFNSFCYHDTYIVSTVEVHVNKVQPNLLKESKAIQNEKHICSQSFTVRIFKLIKLSH